MSAEPTGNPDLTVADLEGEADGEFPAPFGQYLLLHPIARGGMGNVFLAKTGGMMGIEKHCVVKTLRTRFTDDPEYVQRFVDEARLVVQLSHRNICPVFDVGRVGASYYLAMELVIGRDVRSVLNGLIERESPLPEACALHIACEMLDALDYAHRHSDPATGEPLHIVHRDVSPQNVLINFEGEVKLIDFGLAETGRDLVNDDDKVTTGTATVMGKIAYMAPEHARGDVVDARADQFAAAVVAYEMLVGERYYANLSSQEVWLTAGSGAYKADGLARLDPALRAILMRGLSPQREDRYPSCGDFREALLGYARMKNLHAGARELRSIMADLFAGDLREMRELLQRFAHISSRRGPGFATPASGPGIDDEVFSIATSAHAKTIHDPTEIFPTSGIFDMRPRKKAPRWPLLASIVATVAVVTIAIAALVMMSREPETEVVVVEKKVEVPAPPPPPVVVAPPPPPPVADPDPVQTPDRDKKKTNGKKSGKDTTTKRETPPLSPGAKHTWLRKNCPSLTCTQALASIDPKKTFEAGGPPLAKFVKDVNDCAKLCKPK